MSINLHTHKKSNSKQIKIYSLSAITSYNHTEKHMVQP